MYIVEFTDETIKIFNTQQQIGDFCGTTGATIQSIFAHRINQPRTFIKKGIRQVTDYVEDKVLYIIPGAMPHKYEVTIEVI